MSLWAVEWHDDSPVPGTKARKKRGATRGARDCLRFVDIDDEAFAWDRFPLPELLDANAGAFDPWAVYNVKEHGLFWLNGMKPHKEHPKPKPRAFQATERIQQARRRNPHLIQRNPHSAWRSNPEVHIRTAQH